MKLTQNSKIDLGDSSLTLGMTVF